jgi:hypothetical protein
MALHEIECPECGRVSRIAAQYRKLTDPGMGAVIDWMDCLDPVNCEGCSKAMNDVGYTVGVFTQDGTITAVNSPKPDQS